MSGHCAHEDQAEGLIDPQCEARQFGRLDAVGWFHWLASKITGTEVPFELLGWAGRILLSGYDEYG